MTTIEPTAIDAASASAASGALAPRSAETAPKAGVDDRVTRGLWLLRLSMTAANIATIWLTWPLWQARTDPPNLPVVDLRAWLDIDYAWPLCAASLVVVVLPRIGLAVYVALLVLASLADELRLQPQMVSIVLLWAGTLPGRGWRTVGRAHLVALYLFAGIHKLLSSGFHDRIAHWLWSELWPAASFDGSFALGQVMAWGEVTIALLCISRRTRVAAAVLATILHVSIVVVLSPWLVNVNSSVVPWNAALIVAPWVLIAAWKAPLIESWRSQARWARLAAATLLISPVGYQLGVLDAFFANVLYSGGIPEGFACTVFSRRSLNEMWDTLNVPVPPNERTFRRYFLATRHPGEWLEIEDTRLLAKWRGRTLKKLTIDETTGKLQPMSGDP